MTQSVTVPTSTPLVRVPNVELMQTGTWNISTGPVDFTVEDLSAAVTALGCPAVRRPVLKLGHVDPRFDGEPAIGFIDNMATADNGRTLVGDYAGVPGWLGDIMASAYPDRSIEGVFDFVCQMGHTHPFVVEAVALLGVTAPGIGTLASLQDVATLYGVEVAAARSATGTPVTVQAKGSPMPNPSPLRISASVSASDVMRAFYASPAGQGWDTWIEELQLEPLQVIYLDDSTNDRFRAPVIIGEGDGTDAVSFGDPIKVVIRYDDAPTTANAAASSDRVIRFASRAESRPDAPQTPAAAAEGTSNTEEGSPVVSYTDDQLATLRQTLGLPGDADESAINTAVLERLAAPADPPPAAELPEGTVAIDSTQLEALQVAAARGEEARARQEREDRAALVAAAVTDGRIPPARREHWEAQLAADSGSAEVLAKLAPGLIPVGAEKGHAGTVDDDPLYASVFGEKG